MKPDLVRGCGVALVTPFNNGKIDFDSLEKLVEIHVQKSGSIIVAGTTGENATLNENEYEDLIKFVVEKVHKRVPVIAGAGSNSTEKCIKHSKYCEKVGADALLLVTPYYNKTTQRGLINHYKLIAESTKLPIILYNVPGRTGMNIDPKTVLELSKFENIVGLKEASKNFGQIAEILSILPCKGSNFHVYSGDDDVVVPLLALGGKGVISVLANIMPEETKKMVDDFFGTNETDKKQSFANAKDFQLKVNKLIGFLFCETNPIPIKKAMEMMGLCKSEVRAPLFEMSEENVLKLRKEMESLGLIPQQQN